MHLNPVGLIFERGTFGPRWARRRAPRRLPASPHTRAGGREEGQVPRTALGRTPSPHTLASDSCLQSWERINSAVSGLPSGLWSQNVDVGPALAGKCLKIWNQGPNSFWIKAFTL